MKYKYIKCPSCDRSIKLYNNPIPTVDIIIRIDFKIVLVKRKNPPFGWALPGGFVDYGETLEEAAAREAFEETSLKVTIKSLLGCYSDPKRDSRMHTISAVFIAEAEGVPTAGDDAAECRLFELAEIPDDLCFDHREIINDFIPNLITSENNITQ